MSDQWYYSAAGQQVGPVSGEQLRGMIAAGQVGYDVLAWREGMAQWTAVAQLPELSSGAAAQPQYGVAPGAAQGSVPLQYGGYAPTATAAYGQVEYAGFWIRVGAYIIDYLVLLIPNYIISLIVSGLMATPFSTTGRGAPPSAAALGIVVVLYIIQIVANWLYWALMESSSKQASLGKMACGIIVTDINGQRLTFGRATGRYFAKILSFMICAIGVIMVGFDQQKRGLHDQIAKTFVIKKPWSAPQ